MKKHERNELVNCQEDRNHDEVVVSIKQVSKKFCRNLRRSMAYGIVDLSKDLVGMKPDTHTLRQSEFWALDDVSFELRRGDRLGIIGMNGSGKTTLLRLLTGIFPPDKGEIQVKGRVGALVAVGAGFHPHMTGRENIYLNGTILGMSQKEIQAKFESIIAFSEIGEFLDAPVSTYSSGMRVRLGFAIAIHCEPDILLIDEVLSIGDLAFRNKSLRRMHEFQEKANALIFVSHQLEQIRTLCNRVIILNKGKIVFDGLTHEGCVRYEEIIRGRRLDEISHTSSQTPEKKVRKRISSFEEFELIEAGILNSHHQKTVKIAMDDPLIIYWDFKLKKVVENVYFNAGVMDQDRRLCISVTSKEKEKIQFPALQAGRNYRIMIEIPQHHLTPNVYILSMFIRSDRTGETFERIWSDYAFQVMTDGTTLGRGVVVVHANWALERLN